MKKVTLAKDFTDRVDASMVRNLRAGWSGEVSDDKAAEMEAAGVLAVEASAEPPAPEVPPAPDAADPAMPDTGPKKRR